MVSGFKIAIIGSGPAGLTAAKYLVKYGHEIHIFEKFPLPGGMMTFVIPSKRIPLHRIQQIKNEIERLGVTLHLNTLIISDFYTKTIGDEFSISKIQFRELLNKFDCVIIASGTWIPRRLNIDGENLRNVYTALDYLYSIKLYELNYLNQEPEVGKKIAVIGAGRSAVDVVETLLKKDVEKIYLIYRRKIQEAPAFKELTKFLNRKEIEVVEEVLPIKFRGRNYVNSIVLMKVKRIDNKFVPIEGEEFEINIDSVIEAIGEIASPPFTKDYMGIKVRQDYTIDVDEYYRTTRKGVFAIGDVAHGPSNIGKATKSGVDVVKYVNLYLEKGIWRVIE